MDPNFAALQSPEQPVTLKELAAAGVDSFQPWAPLPFVDELTGIRYSSAQQFAAVQKALFYEDGLTLLLLLQSTDPFEIARLDHEMPTAQNDPEVASVDAAHIIHFEVALKMQLCASQHAAIAAALVATGSRPILADFDPPLRPGYLGGKCSNNALGEILVRVRDLVRDRLVLEQYGNFSMAVASAPSGSPEDALPLPGHQAFVEPPIQQAPAEEPVRTDDLELQALIAQNYEKYSFFWQGPFSNWHPSTFDVDGVQYNNGEQFMMVQKALVFGDLPSAALAIQADNPKRVKAIGRGVKNFVDEQWICHHAWDIVYRGNRCRFSQNPELKHLLFSTRGKCLVEASPYDTRWGIGLSESDAVRLRPEKWPGKNLLGKVLDTIRDDMLEDEAAEIAAKGMHQGDRAL
eukprot:TRINITY_DN28185_c0_g2_i1.p1 TRINITY_DN28185_c0_g2~~TRINITY_DN28185_c0_g2_i1.p1  ORF type:complete len:420 (-),score=65.12 TRINITY_DN28185_c0_g2_i1:120-1334(-)